MKSSLIIGSSQLGVRCPCCNQSLLTNFDSCGVCGWMPKFLEENPNVFLEETPTEFLEEKSPKISSKKNPSGCLYRYLEHKTLKSGIVATYPRVEGIRNPNNLNHWRWGYNWEEKINGVWKNRSIAVPRRLVSLVKSMISEGKPTSEIRAFIKSRKPR
ncbi:hypothetical protein [Iningainema tapete]|uniref:Cysteine-rich CPCC domain-containing protein n=1 Tax=Iningainema tapete BLCC-T55 TaxID=2748662 RepID=A0A8J7C0T1_9CYAN|nr:hypothetical protein [Iningainema tapete]MBD2778638.1 hypothetical protein [Iningainema tapete BLCC-T55]